jgi:hypothetical protein
MSDIDRLSALLGYIWAPEKDIPFSSIPKYFGFLWNLILLVVSIPAEKMAKYLASIEEWETQGPQHSLQEAQALHGKLLHICLVLRSGRAYITELERFMGEIAKAPSNFVSHRPNFRLAKQLQWWKSQLQKPSLSRPIPGPADVIEPNAYSDASSTTGVGVWINGYWGAWRLLPEWKCDNRDI